MPKSIKIIAFCQLSQNQKLHLFVDYNVKNNLFNASALFIFCFI